PCAYREVGRSAPHGYTVDNRVLRCPLFDRAAILPSLKLLAPLAVAATTADEGGAVVRLADGAQLRTRLVAAADGQNSPLRRAAGLGPVEWRYLLPGLDTHCALERPTGFI